MTRDETLTAEEVEGKSTELLSKHILELQADKGKLIDENKDLKETIDKLREQLALRYDLEDKVAELEAQIEKMKNCKNCANYMISGKCPCFFRTGWCKNWEMTRSK